MPKSKRRGFPGYLAGSDELQGAGGVSGVCRLFGDSHMKQEQTKLGRQLALCRSRLLVESLRVRFPPHCSRSFEGWVDGANRTGSTNSQRSLRDWICYRCGSFLLDADCGG